MNPKPKTKGGMVSTEAADEKIKYSSVAKIRETKPDGVTEITFKEFELTMTKNMYETLDRKQARTTEILAIFITLFTFISVNVSIFQHVGNVVTAIFFMLLMTGCSLILVSFLFITICEKQKFFPLWLILIVTYAGMFYLLMLASTGKLELILKEKVDSLFIEGTIPKTGSGDTIQ